MNCNYIRLSNTEVLLPRYFIYNLGLPRPTQAVFRNYTVRRPKGKGGIGEFGYSNVEILWEVLLPKHAFTIRNLVQTALESAGGVIYCTIDRANGSSNNKDWVDFTGIPQMPIFEEANDGLPITYFEDVSLVITDLIVLNDPATGI